MTRKIEQTEPKTAPVDIGNVIARQVFLRSHRETGAAYCWPPMSFSERYEREKRDPGLSIKSLSGLHIDDCDGKWFLFAEVDCFDPPVYAVRADSLESAYETFIEEFATIVTDPDLADYDEDDERLSYTSRGMVDTESIQGWETQLHSVEC